MTVSSETAAKRLLRFLAAGGARVSKAADGATVLVEADGRGPVAVPAACLRELAKAMLISRAGDRVSLTESGRAAAVQLLAGMGGTGERQRVIEVGAVEVEGSLMAVAINLAESPLALLARLRSKRGEPFLSAAEVQAGERLRADFTRGQIMPRVGANWVASVASGRRSDGGGAIELTEAAMSARRRVERAIEAVGPELSGVLLDVCCFLKGLEVVERERLWPVRSAKLMLKAALSSLARHYGFRRQEKGGAAILHWGAEDYRPRIGD